ncbi:M48 family metalloprotease [Sphingobium sp. DEHP117]|uniref:M48 family metalloprotease n=1 Tax=Sphingobium sp. DEHP117 TaxID=2993436 RepID=UPI0027D50A88|nr:M48 family metalloprotease [Sphingobium sp. DEHP117]MDQ4419064.1 M48 family metalloprotease [Sphingobium sp. DEHP117]
MACGEESGSKTKPIPLATSISAKDKQEGAKAHPELLQEFGGAYQGPQTAYVVNVGRKIASQSSLSSVQSDFTVTLLNSSVNNAFAIPGGYVYITRQLMALCNDEAEMAGVLGHEVGHVAAMHSQRRQKAATRNAIGGTLLQILTQATLGSSGLGGLLQQGIGQGAQLLTLKFSRSQEYEADDLGIRYLAKGGYDPKALSSMLASLAAQSALDARISGQTKDMPEWASTHPDPASRVQRALQRARDTGSTNTLRNRDAFLAALNGVIYGDDPKQGVVNGSQFIHPDLRIAFTAPTGFALNNGTQAVTISGSSGQAQFSGGPYSGNLDSYVTSVFRALAKNDSFTPQSIQHGSVGGMNTAYTTVQANGQSGPVDVTVIAYELAPNQAFHFITMTAAGQGFGPFAGMTQSFRRINAQEAAAVKPRKVAVVTVKSGDTVNSLSARMAYNDYRLERFLTLNALNASSTLTPGQKVKIVTY